MKKRRMLSKRSSRKMFRKGSRRKGLNNLHPLAVNPRGGIRL